MSGKQTNRQVICDVLMEKAQKDKSITVICSDSRGSGAMTSFSQSFPEQFVEVGIAEQNLVSIAAGMAKCGRKVFAVAPASFLTTRSYEQIKVDVAYSNANVKLIGISGGISYGALGMTHHSLQDTAAMCALPNLEVFMPSDRFQTKHLTEQLLQDDKPAYIRVGRGPSEDIYSENYRFDGYQAVIHGNLEPCDVMIAACGEMTAIAVEAGKRLMNRGICCCVMDMLSLKPIDEAAVCKAAFHAKAVITIEEHSAFGGLGAQICQILSARQPKRVMQMALPDEPVIAGENKAVFDYYGLSVPGIVSKVQELLEKV